ncbi:MAG: hypothetical protein IPK61_04320 [Saprospiraceae bacterium]|nr:hypothetical protein [Saprospiraceae bacterium]
MSIIQIALELGFIEAQYIGNSIETLHLVHLSYMEAQERRIGVNREHKEREGRIKLQAILDAKWINYLKSSEPRANRRSSEY